MRNSLIILTIFASFSSFGQTSSKNYVKTIAPKEGVETITGATQVATTVKYIDGLGRPIQSIHIEGSPEENDIIVPVEYDVIGRQTKNYLPYTKAGNSGNFDSNAINNQSHFHDIYYGGTSGDYAFSETVFEASPLNRVLEQGSPGADWQTGGATVTYDYQSNSSVDAVKMWEMDGLQASSRETYNAGELYKNSITDENGNVTITFTNKQGETILKKSEIDGTWAHTYYIYDDLGRLKIVLPPESNNLVNQHLVEIDGMTMLTEDHTLVTSERDDDLIYTFDATVTIPAGITLIPGSYIRAMEVLTPEFLNTWAFQYEYDTRNRMISKQVPGSEKVLMVYDQWDRLVLTQDGNQRTNDEWLFTKYDELNRPVMTGIMTGGNEATVRNAAENPANVRGENFSIGGNNQYTNDTYPSSNLTYLSVTYYDNYDWDNTGLEFTNPAGLAQNAAVRGQVTGTLTKNDNSWIKSASYYDDKYRLIQSQSTNHLGGDDIVTNYFDFIGQLDKSISSHYDGTKTTTITRIFKYDHTGRLIQTWHEIDGEASVLIAENEYKELGELIQKNVHYEGSQSNPSENAFEQNTNYSYNIRGWLTSINDTDLAGSTDLFGMHLYYNSNSIDPSNTNFNGNISAMEWSDAGAIGDGNSRAYNYDYDQLNRLTSANHLINGSNNDVAINDPFDVEISEYDLNGNIKALVRNGDASGNIDNLTYTYNGNQLLKVTDTGTSEGFDNGNSGTGNDYTYDANGNMISDANKGITNIDYNHLNLPTEVTMSGSGNRIEYLYDAAGIKLQQKVYESNTLTKTTDYVGEFIYEDGDLQLIQQEEGRIIPLDQDHPEYVSGTKEHDYQYHLKDHLGNVRVTFSTTPENYERTASFEDNNQSTESLEFGNITANRVSHPLSTNLGKAARLNNAAPAGPYAVLSVNKGDTVHLSAKGYYNGGSGYSNPIPAGTFQTFLQDAVNTSQTLLESGLSSAVIDNGISTALAALGVGGSNSNTVPGAYINYLIFDRDMNYQGIAGYTQISSAANGAEELIERNDVLIDREGYLIAYLSNESNTSNYVYFDDFKIDHRKTNIVSTQDHYPFGLSFNESVRTASTPQNFKYNGKESIKELGWVDYGARMYQPEIGRWSAIDPLSEKFKVLSPYNYVANNPISFIDIDGRDIVNPRNMVLSNRAFIKKMRQFDRALARISNQDKSSYNLTITGGDRYKKDGLIRSRTNDKVVKNSNADSFHLQENGATGADFSREHKFTEKQLKAAAKEVGLQYQAGYKDGHFHLESESKEVIDSYKNDPIALTDYVPNDFELNNEGSEESNESESANSESDPRQFLFNSIIKAANGGDMDLAQRLAEILNESNDDEK